MEVVRSQKKASLAAASSDAVSTIPLYRSAPTLEEFERFAVDWLLVLRGISDGLARGKKPDEMDKVVTDLWKANMRHPQASEVVNKDIIYIGIEETVSLDGKYSVLLSVSARNF